MAEGDILTDSENYRSNEQNTYKSIVMKQVQRVVDNFSKEMTTGFWLKSNPNPNQTAEKIRYIPDSRKELKQSLNTLHDLLLARFDEPMRQSSKDIYKEIEVCRQKFRKFNPDEESQIKYWRVTLKLYRRLFQELCMFLQRISWLEVGAVEE